MVLVLLQAGNQTWGAAHDIPPGWAAIAGAVIGGVLTLIGSYLVFMFQSRSERKIYIAEYLIDIANKLNALSSLLRANTRVTPDAANVLSESIFIHQKGARRALGKEGFEKLRALHREAKKAIHAGGDFVDDKGTVSPPEKSVWIERAESFAAHLKAEAANMKIE